DGPAETLTQPLLFQCLFSQPEILNLFREQQTPLFSQDPVSFSSIFFSITITFIRPPLFLFLTYQHPSWLGNMAN
ncbi:hypothetical protein L249_2543, partial [Ophiocordyceps polyrhachis-furcata BCC 54312]